MPTRTANPAEDHPVSESASKAMRYFVYKAGEKIGSLRRVNMAADPVVLQRWDGKKWIWSPSSIDAVSGFASDTGNYQEVTAAKAKEITGKA